MNFNLPGDVTFTFSNNILNMSQVNINGGTVWFTGQVAGDVTIASGATLGGNFTVFGSLGNYGTLSPGNTIGTATVNGNYTQAYGGKLEVEIARTASRTLMSDQLHVTGTATLAAGSIIDVAYGGRQRQRVPHRRLLQRDHRRHVDRPARHDRVRLRVPRYCGAQERQRLRALAAQRRPVQLGRRARQQYGDRHGPGRRRRLGRRATTPTG